MFLSLPICATRWKKERKRGKYKIINEEKYDINEIISDYV